MTDNAPSQERIWLAYAKKDKQTQVKSEYGGLVELQNLPTHLLKSVFIFQDLTEDEADIVAHKCVWARFNEGRQLLVENDPTNDIFFVLEGRVMAKSFSASGREVTYVEIGSGGIFGEFSSIDGEQRSASIVTADASLVARMSSDNFRNILQQYPSIALHLCELLVQKARGLTQRVYEFSTLTVRHRIRAELVRICAEIDAQYDATIVIDPAPTHYELATRVSTHREAVSRELSQLASAGVLKLSRRTITILDINKLTEMATANIDD